MPDELQTNLDYSFRRFTLLKQALTHKSYVHEHSLDATESNERLEYLGDAILDLLISDLLYHRYPDVAEGKLTQQRANLVCEPSLAELARKIKLGNYIYLGQGETQEGGRNKNSILADTMEAVFGAIYLDGGIEGIQYVVQRLFEPIVETAHKQVKDNKSTLQELLQKDGSETAVYTIIQEEGPPHQRVFTSEVSHMGKPLGRGKGRSKKEAEQNAAKLALDKIKK